MIGSTRLEQMGLHCLTPKVSRLVVTSQISSYCGTPAPKKMKRSELVQTRDHVKRGRTQARMNMARYTGSTMSGGPERTKSSFASRLRPKRVCERFRGG